MVCWLSSALNKLIIFYRNRVGLEKVRGNRHAVRRNGISFTRMRTGEQSQGHGVGTETNTEGRRRDRNDLRPWTALQFTALGKKSVKFCLWSLQATSFSA